MKLLKTLYRIYSPSGKEEKMRRFLAEYVKKIPGVTKKTDKTGNIYITKGKAETYPAVVAHIDQVESLHSGDFKPIETKDIIFGYSMNDRQTQNLGADDKNGVWIALKCLEKFDCLKVAFFVNEESGCGGSSKADLDFFADCRFVIQPDRKGNSDLISSIGWTDLCSEEFLLDIDYEKFGYKETDGMMTDVQALKENGLGVSCINLSCAYYLQHTEHEYTVKKDLMKCLRFVEHIIEVCTKTYPHEAKYDYYMDYEVDDDIWIMLEENPGVTSDEIYDYFHPIYPNLTLNDIERVMDNFKFFYDNEEDLIKGNPICELKPKKNEDLQEHQHGAVQTICSEKKD